MEQVRLNLGEGVPVVVQQWQSLIAVNYPARAYGITRHMSITEAKQKCPSLVSVHTAAYQLPSTNNNNSESVEVLLKEFGPGSPPPASSNHKVSLDAYRQASKRIFKLLRDRFGSKAVEKASVDEAYLDVTEIVQERMDSEFPDWRQWDNKVPSDVELLWDGHPACLIQEEEENKKDELEMQDVQIWIGALIAKELREEIKEVLGYTCSVGIAPNKTLAKLASPRNKPNGQTYVTPRMVLPWMRTIPFDKIRFLGGKLGKQIISGTVEDESSEDDESESEELKTTNTTSSLSGSAVVYAGDLWPLSLEEMQNKVGGEPQLALWVFNLIRGIDETPVKPRALTKTFLSAKNFRPPVNNEDVLSRWLIVLSTELQHRLEEEAMDTRRWPRTITLSYRKLDMPSSRSKAADFPFPPQSSTAVKISSHVMTRLIKPLQATLFPLAFIGLSLGRFTEVGEDARGMGTLDAFTLQKREAGEDDDLFSTNTLFPTPKSTISTTSLRKKTKTSSNNYAACDITKFFTKKESSIDNPSITNNLCPKCHKEIGSTPEAVQEHNDFHLAMQLAGLEK